MSGSRPGVGIVTWRTEAFNQRDELVLACLRTNLVRTRELLGRSSGRLG
jgi:acyl dehydratase